MLWRPRVTTASYNEQFHQGGKLGNREDSTERVEVAEPLCGQTTA